MKDNELIILIVVMILIIGIIDYIRKQLNIRNSINYFKSEVEASFNNDEINEEQRNSLIFYANTNNCSHYNFAEYKRQHLLIKKYGEEIGNVLINKQYWLGMTKEQLIDCKGEPDRIEHETLKTKKKEIIIYGNKNSGDYFVIEQGAVVKIVDR